MHVTKPFTLVTTNTFTYLCNNCHLKIHTVITAPNKAMPCKPQAAATPKAAATQILAAVTNCLWLPEMSPLMAPEPKKPIPVLMAAPILVGSPPKPCRLVREKMAAPRLTRLKVRIPALAEAARRSVPMMAPQVTATHMRKMIWASTAGEREDVGRRVRRLGDWEETETEGSEVREGEVKGGGSGVVWRAAVEVANEMEKDLERWANTDGELNDVQRGKGARNVKAGNRRGGGMALGKPRKGM